MTPGRGAIRERNIVGVQRHGTVSCQRSPDDVRTGLQGDARYRDQVPQERRSRPEWLRP